MGALGNGDRRLTAAYPLVGPLRGLLGFRRTNIIPRFLLAVNIFGMVIILKLNNNHRCYFKQSQKALCLLSFLNRLY